MDTKVIAPKVPVLVGLAVGALLLFAAPAVAVVALDAKDSVTHFRLGMVLRAVGEADASAAALARAKQLDPNH